MPISGAAAVSLIICTKFANQPPVWTTGSQISGCDSISSQSWQFLKFWELILYRRIFYHNKQQLFQPFCHALTQMPIFWCKSKNIIANICESVTNTPSNSLQSIILIHHHHHPIHNLNDFHLLILHLILPLICSGSEEGQETAGHFVGW